MARPKIIQIVSCAICADLFETTSKKANGIYYCSDRCKKEGRRQAQALDKQKSYQATARQCEHIGCEEIMQRNQRFCQAHRIDHQAVVQSMTHQVNRHGRMTYEVPLDRHHHVSMLRYKFAAGDVVEYPHPKKQGEFAKLIVPADFEIEHKIPVSKGGQFVHANVILGVTELNRRAGDSYCPLPTIEIPNRKFTPTQVVRHYAKEWGDKWNEIYKPNSPLVPKQDYRDKLGLKNKTISQVRAALGLPNSLDHWVRKLSGFDIPDNLIEEWAHRRRTQPYNQVFAWLHQQCSLIDENSTEFQPLLEMDDNDFFAI